MAPQKLLPRARMLAVRSAKQVQLFPAGQSCVNQLGQIAPKYEKLVYSSRFGFSVSRGESLEEGAFDSCLAVSEAGEERWRMQRGFDAFTADEDHIWRKFSPMKGVTVEVTVTPCFPSHRRAYVITTDRPIDVADGGFAIPAEWEGEPYQEDMVEWTEDSVTARLSEYQPAPPRHPYPHHPPAPGGRNTPAGHSGDGRYRRVRPVCV